MGVCMSRFATFLISFLFFFSLKADLSLSALKRKVDSADENQQIIGAGELFDSFKTYQAIAKKELSRDVWIDQSPDEKFFKFDSFYPFMQKVAIAPESEVIMWGDFHGSARALLEGLSFLQNEHYIDNHFNIMNPHCYFVFLGDYVDRWDQGIEILYTILRLKCANPDHVILLRGNHEDVTLNQYYDFEYEILTKYAGVGSFLFAAIKRFYETLPSALVLESENNCILCCHGGIEVGINPEKLVQSIGPVRYQLFTIVDRENSLPVGSALHDALITRVPASELAAFSMPLERPSNHSFGCLWSDFELCEQESISYGERGIRCGKALTHYYLDQISNGEKKVRAIFRGHQHNGDMYKDLIENRGLVKLWSDLVYTLLASSESMEEDIHFASFVKITTASDYTDWSVGHWFRDIKIKAQISRLFTVWQYLRENVFAVCDCTCCPVLGRRLRGLLSLFLLYKNR
ncbi:MAG: Serine/threonine-protein phosphatase [candidate division TM6 bacterium GW2011_GWE2_36_25]|nr:MAG: Serine/threonine-protein phosphatase [candidate division TM6 bacterium GW2011_GWE2_36_25]